MKTDVETGVIWPNVLSALRAERWESNEDGDGVERRVCLGSIFSWCPSGKFYMPWACSNLDPCPVCGGSGVIGGHKSLRVRKRAAARIDRLYARGRRRGRACRIADRGLILRAEHACRGSQCERCGGCGSHEAHDDEVFWELLEQEADEHGLWVDVVDEMIFVGESADSDPDSEEEADDESR